MPSPKKSAEKQKRYRENMKAAGYKQVLLWALPCDTGVRETMTAAGYRQAVAWEKPESGYKIKSKYIKVAAEIKINTIGAADTVPELKDALASAAGALFNSLDKSKVSKETRAAFTTAFLALIRPLGDPWND